MFKQEMQAAMETITRNYQNDHKHDDPNVLKNALKSLTKRMECIMISVLTKYRDCVEIRGDDEKVEKKRVPKDADITLGLKNKARLMRLSLDYKAMKNLVSKFDVEFDLNFAPAIEIMTKQGLLSCY